MFPYAYYKEHYTKPIECTTLITDLLKIKSNPNDLTITGEFDKWVYSAGKKLQGLVERRKKEAELYFKQS